MGSYKKTHVLIFQLLLNFSKTKIEDLLRCLCLDSEFELNTDKVMVSLDAHQFGPVSWLVSGRMYRATRQVVFSTSHSIQCVLPNLGPDVAFYDVPSTTCACIYVHTDASLPHFIPIHYQCCTRCDQIQCTKQVDAHRCLRVTNVLDRSDFNNTY